MIGGESEISVFWGSVGTAVAAALAGGLGWVGGRHRRAADSASYQAESVGHQAIAVIIDQLRGEVTRLSTRVTELERERRDDRKHIYALEWALRNAGLDPLVVVRQPADEE